MRGRLPTAGEGPPACPFVAFAEEPDSRSGVPDHRHRCHALDPPEPRAFAHQERYCLTSAYPGCAYFQDWAVRHAAESVAAPGTVGASWTADRPTRNDRTGERPPVPAAGARFERARAVASRLAGGRRASAGQLSAFGNDEERTGGITYPTSRGVDHMGSSKDPRDTRYESDPGYGDAARYADARDYGEDPAAALDYAQGGAADARDPRYADRRYAPQRDQASQIEYAGAPDNRRARYAGGREDDPEPARGVEYGRSRTGRTSIVSRNGGREPYSGYPTAARLLGIAPLPPADDFDDEPEPGKWERSGRLQSWLEDAEQGASIGRLSAAEEVEELEAGVMPARAMQARRIPAAPLRPVTRNNARRALPWERRAAEDGYPRVRVAQSGRRIPPVLVAALVLVFAAAVLFALPSMLALVAGRPRPPATQAPLRPTPAAVVAPATPEPTEAPPAAPTPRIYRVRAGDNLSRIAARYNVTVKEILAANPDITDPAQIKIGQRITIPLSDSP